MLCFLMTVFPPNIISAKIHTREHIEVKICYVPNVVGLMTTIQKKTHIPKSLQDKQIISTKPLVTRYFINKHFNYYPARVGLLK